MSTEDSQQKSASASPAQEKTVASDANESAAAAAPSPASPTPPQAQSPTPSNNSSGAATNGSLYVGELEENVSEAMLFELFSSIGPVSSIRVCRDAVTRRSLGYAYVNFHSAADGHRALDELNYTLIRGKACRIMWSQRDPSLRKTGTGNVFIKNLDVAIDNKALHDTFNAFGPVLSCKVATDEMGSSRGYGFVHFEKSADADNAIKHVNGMLLNEKKVFVGLHIPKKDRLSKFEALKANFTNIYVKNVPLDTTDDEFTKLFEKYGDITSASLTKDEEGKNKGFGFVNFTAHESAEEAVHELNDIEFKGQQLYVGRAQKKSERDEELRRHYESIKQEKLTKYQGVNLFVKNLHDDVNDAQLRDEFAVFGQITSAKVMMDDSTGKSRGFGFVCFSNPEEATKAVSEMNQRMVNGKPLYVAVAQRKDARKSQLEAQRAAAAQRMPMPMYYPPPMGGRMPLMPRGGARGMPMPMMPGMYMPNGYPGPGAYRPQMRPQMVGPRPGMPMPMMGGPQRGMMGRRPDMFNASLLAGVAPENQKQILGEALFPKIQMMESQLAGKITGMLLEMDNNELIHLVDDEIALKGKVDEALLVLKEFQDKEKTDLPTEPITA